MLKLNTLSGFGSGVSAGGAGSVYGYCIGGQVYPGSNTSASMRITFSTSVGAAHTDSDSSYAAEGPRGNYCGTGYGQHGSGYDAGYTNILNTLTWATGVSATTTNTLATTVIGAAQSSDSVTYGYWCGGGGGGASTLAGRATFSTGVHALHTDADLSTPRKYQSQMTHPLLYGYSTGGYKLPHPTRADASDRITFSTGVGAAHTDSNLSVGRAQPANTSDNTTYGYHSGGNSGAGDWDVTDRMTFATSVVAAHTDSDLPINTTNAQGCSGAVYGFVLGYTTNWATTADTLRITFSTGVFAAHTDANPAAGRNHPGTLSDASPN